jgi:hypothetical protein
MPQIIVLADRPTEDGHAPVMFRERVTVSDFESGHFTKQLVERLGWAVGDADEADRQVQHDGERSHESSHAHADSLAHADGHPHADSDGRIRASGDRETGSLSRWPDDHRSGLTNTRAPEPTFA